MHLSCTYNILTCRVATHDPEFKVDKSNNSHLNSKHLQSGDLYHKSCTVQVPKLLSKGGHFFMVTVPENNPQGEI